MSDPAKWTRTLRDQHAALMAQGHDYSGRAQRCAATGSPVAAREWLVAAEAAYAAAAALKAARA